MHPSIVLQQKRLKSATRSSTFKPQRLRFSWFIIGSLFGVGVSFLLNLFVTAIVLPGYDYFLTQQTAQVASLEDAIESATLDVAEATPAEPTETFPKTIAMTVPKGGTLLDMIMAEGVSRVEAYTMVEALRDTYSPRQIRVGQQMELTLDKAEDGSLTIAGLYIKLSNITYVEATRAGEGFSVARHEIDLVPELTLAGGTITSSLFQTGYDHGVPNGVLAEMMKAYSYDVDFQRDIQTGDKMEVLFERMLTEEGEPVSYGDILYAKLHLGDKSLPIYRFDYGKDDWGYYDASGHSVVKSLLRTPVNGARISSGFGLRRHPVLGYNKMHKGMDFAAPTGTPIYAAGDGVIEKMGRNGAYGNYVRIRHNDTYATAYAHAHRFASGLRAGSRVKQGQVIAYVGSTGRSTGPHLHYEVLKYGAQVNPSKIKFPTGKKLAGAELENFKRHVAKLEQQIAAMPKSGTRMASAE